MKIIKGIFVNFPPLMEDLIGQVQPEIYTGLVVREFYDLINLGSTTTKTTNTGLPRYS